MWSHKLGCWVYLVSQKTGQNPPGTIEVTPADIERMDVLIHDGWETDTAIERTLGVRPVA